MNTIILRALRGEAQSWWAHKDLRKSGRIAEAQQRERKSIRSQIEIIRKTLASSNAYISAGRGGTCIHAENTTVSSCGGLKHFATARVLICLGLPFVDTNPVRNPVKLISLPMVAVGKAAETAPWGALSYAPLGVYLRQAKALGATVVNFEWTAPRGVDAQAAPGELEDVA